jgi:hypothetical protein
MRIPGAGFDVIALVVVVVELAITILRTGMLPMVSLSVIVSTWRTVIVVISLRV